MLDLHAADQATRLAGAAKIGDFSTRGDLRNIPATAGTGLSAPHVNGEKVAGLQVHVLAHGLADLVDRCQEHLACGFVERFYFIRAKVRRRSQFRPQTARALGRL